MLIFFKLILKCIHLLCFPITWGEASLTSYSLVLAITATSLGRLKYHAALFVFTFILHIGIYKEIAQFELSEVFSFLGGKKPGRGEQWASCSLEYCREKLCFKSRTDGNSEGNSVIGNKVKEVVNIKTTWHLSCSNSDAICASTWFILTAGETNDQEGGGGGFISSTVCLLIRFALGKHKMVIKACPL